MGTCRPRPHAPDHLSERPTISVVTIAWRNADHAAGFASTLAAASELAGGPPTEVIVVVNGDEGDDAAAIVARHVDATVVRLDTNTGFSGGANAGVDRAGGEIVVVANLDLTFDDRFVAALRREAEGDWDLLAPRVTQGATGRDSGVSRRTVSHRLAWVSPSPPGPARVAGGNGACLVLRHATVDRRRAGLGGLFDPECHSFNEDIDLFWWAERRRMLVRYAPDLRVHHALAGSFAGAYRFRDRPVEVQRRVMANYRLTVWKNASGPGQWMGWPLGEAIYAGQAAASGGRAGLRAYAASWPESVRTARAIRQRRDRLRLPDRSPT